MGLAVGSEKGRMGRMWGRPVSRRVLMRPADSANIIGLADSDRRSGWQGCCSADDASANREALLQELERRRDAARAERRRMAKAVAAHIGRFADEDEYVDLKDVQRQRQRAKRKAASRGLSAGLPDLP